MSTHIIKLQQILSPNELNLIEQFSNNFIQSQDFNLLAEFFSSKFNIDTSIDQDIVSSFAIDSSNMTGFANGVCRPKSAIECSVIFSTCYQCKIPITITGGQSNLTGSATPKGGIIVSTVKLTKPDISVDLENQTVSTATGIILENMRIAVKQQSLNKLIYPVDPTSREDASVGGTISTNASGFIPGDNGATRKWVEEIEFILPNGKLIFAKRNQYISENGEFLLESENETIRFTVPTYSRPKIKNASGPYSSPNGVLDFVDLIIGSEGIFGLVTKCVFKLAENPVHYLDLFLTLQSEKVALQLLSALDKQSDFSWDSVLAFEYFGYNCIKFMDHRDNFFSNENAVGIYVSIPIYKDDFENVAKEWIDRFHSIIPHFKEENVIVLQDSQSRRKFFEARHSMPANALEIIRKNEVNGIVTDTIVPPGNFNKFLKYTHKLLRDNYIEYLLFGHLGDCHLHFHILPRQDQQTVAEKCYQLIIEKSSELGGVYSAEHGTGKRKRTDFLKCYGQDAVNQVIKSKACIDPYYILNRGNVIEPPPG
ncbi:MAG: FAD-binding oxidoreductase [Candidatus Marinimicrobia bacterium]|nr:FAD-binding oxidoreductase [Candidatus Neomarinimicrobiota bacterium]MBL7022827.1 FAD-binding oxidoreductase [Candidatus Neomarinimicrobiota bacterium]MBL7109452.1 FAD-binding oxidoreductase [Candidatus Neomarinimicrobiota bacterium]